MNHNRPTIRPSHFVALLLLIGSLWIVACGPVTVPSDAQQQAQKAAQNAASRRTYYQPLNDVEGKNYEARLRISDDPKIGWR